MPRIRRFSESLPMLLLRGREVAMARFRPILHANGLTEQQWRVLRALDELGDSSAAGLAAECSILAPSMTRILKKLTVAGLVATRRSEADQRELIVTMTADGRRLVGRVGPQIEEEYARLRSALELGHLERLSAELRRLIALDRNDTAD